MYVAIDGQAAGLIAVADTIKPTSREALRRFAEMGIEAVMITGDNARTAAAVARELGIARFFAEVLPADKARHVQELQAEGKRVAMVGDGVNDAPALAQADIGIAIGAGTDVAIETAQVVLMKSDPLDIVNAITISKATVRKMKQNLVWASIYNILAIPVAAGVLYPVTGDRAAAGVVGAADVALVDHRRGECGAAQARRGRAWDAERGPAKCAARTCPKRVVPDRGGAANHIPPDVRKRRRSSWSRQLVRRLC